MGDTREAWSVEQCYRDNRDSVFRLCLRYAGGRADWAEDATQEVFIKLIESFSRIDSADHARSWLYRVAAHVSISRLRRDRLALLKLRELITGTHEPVVPSVERLFEGKQEAAEAVRQLQRLPVMQRVVVCMNVLDGHSQKQIAETLELSEGYVSKLMSGAWKSLREAGWEVAS